MKLTGSAKPEQPRPPQLIPVLSVPTEGREVGSGSKILDVFGLVGRAGVSRRLQGPGGVSAGWAWNERCPERKWASEPAIGITLRGGVNISAAMGDASGLRSITVSTASRRIGRFRSARQECGGRRRATPASSKSGSNGQPEVEWSHSGIGTAVGFARARE